MKYNVFALALLTASLGSLYYTSTTAAPRESIYETTQQATVAHVIDGDTFVTLGGAHVRLIGINTPERGKNGQPAEPLYEEAKQELKKRIDGKVVTLKLGKKKRDKYKRLLANIYTQNGTWINQEMIKSGLAHVYSFPDTAGAHIGHLLDTEKTARGTQKGLWGLPRWQVKNANTQANISAKDVGQFHLVQGRVRTTADVKNRLYLNFGDDWRTDFTAEIPPKYRHKFNTNYINKNVLIHGVIKPVNGYMITLTHPQQIEILD